MPIDNFAFCTDDKHLSTIYREGHIDRNVILAVSLGLPLLDAVKMASTSPARFYNLQDRGSIEIGKIADIVILESEINPKVSMVFKRGVLACDILKNDGIAIKNLQNNLQNNLQIDTTRQDETDDGISVENHKVANGISKSECKNTEKYMQNSVHFKDFVAKDFEVFWKEKNTAIQLIENQLLTNAVALSQEEAKKATLLATIERYGKNGNYSLCPLLGYDIKCGAVATSVSHDSHNVVVAGDNASDMACAVNRLKQIGGGYVIASGGKIEGELCLDIAGLMSSSGAEAVADKIAQLEKIATKRHSAIKPWKYCNYRYGQVGGDSKHIID
ncbi:MAG: adenine deaminase C-terminal domain-containing protein, partial [Clostridia bacterium]